jgi:hypothetical protein
MEYVLAKQEPRVAWTSSIPADDRRAVDALYRRVFGHDAAEASRLRWEWQYRATPTTRAGPEIWVAREGPAIVGQYATMPVRLWVRGPGSRRRDRGAWT